VAVVHETMRGTAQAMAKVSGMPDYEFLTVGYPHVPLAVWSSDEIDDVARALAPRLTARLTADDDADGAG
jgi:hypothetical protein